MKRHFLPRHLLAIACFLGLVACAPPDHEDAAAMADEAALQPNPATSATIVESPASATEDASAGETPGWNGIGGAAFGMDETAFRQAWQGKLSGSEFEDKASCFHLWPATQQHATELAFMFEGGKFVRYGTESKALAAPGGGRVGMTGADIESRYPGRIEQVPHKYTDGQYLRITQGEDVLIFETDGAGKVTEWRVGVPPYVDYVEGCA